MTIREISPGREMHLSHRSSTAWVHSSTADGHSLPPSSRFKTIGEPSMFDEKDHACLYAVIQSLEICSSSALDQGTTPALYRNTGTTPILIPISLSVGDNTLSVLSADRRCCISVNTWVFSWLKSPFSATRTPSCLCAWFEPRAGKATPFSFMLSVAIVCPVAKFIAAILLLNIFTEQPIHPRYSPAG